MSETAFFAVVFPQGKIFLGDFLTSLDHQSYKDFDVVIANDGIDDLDHYTKDHPGLKIVSFEVERTPAGNRQVAFDYLLKHKYKAVVFGDLDDYYAPERVECSLELLAGFDIVVNDFDLVDEKKHVLKKGYLSSRLTEGQFIGLEMIRNKNILGFANTAVRVEKLKGIILDEQAIALDWFFFTCLLAEGARAVFTSRTKTFHRVYADNLAAIDQIDEKSVLSGLKAKAAHYECLAKRYPQHAQDRDEYQGIYDRAVAEEGFRQEYTRTMRAGNRDNPFWYEIIQPIKK